MIFWNSCTENFRKYSGKHLQFKFNENARLQSTAYHCQTKTSITDIFWKCSEEKECSKIQLQQNRLQEKSFLLVFWNSWKYFKKRSTMQWSHFIKVRRLLFRILMHIKYNFMNFSGGFRNNSCFENFRELPEKRLW